MHCYTNKKHQHTLPLPPPPHTHTHTHTHTNVGRVASGSSAAQRPSRLHHLAAPPERHDVTSRYRQRSKKSAGH